MIELLRKFPGLAVSVGYLLISAIGMAFNWVLFSEFSVNVFHYSEVSDFLMAAFREPLTFLLAASALLVTLFFGWIGRLERRWFEGHPPKWRLTRAYQKYSQSLYTSVHTPWVVFVLYGLLFLSVYGDHKAGKIRDGRGDRVSVSLSGESTQGALREGLLLGSTNRFLLLYEASGGVVVLPYENVLAVELLAQRGSAD